MRPSHLMALLMSPTVAAIFVGCGPATPPPVAAPVIHAATPEQAAQTQNDLMKTEPNARVGHVAAVNSGMGMASVAGIPVAEVKVGDTLVFTDAKQTPIATGTVRSIDTTTDASYQFLIVDYKASPTGRDLVRNDLAVFLPTH